MPEQYNGSGAFGTLTITKGISKYSKAKLFSAIGKKTDAFLRFSTVAGERGTADAERDMRGFAMILSRGEHRGAGRIAAAVEGRSAV